MAKQVEYRGIGFLPLLAILFIGLKLGGVIAWSWWWVLAPLWAPFAVVFGIVAVVAVIAVGAEFLGKR